MTLYDILSSKKEGEITRQHGALGHVTAWQIDGGFL